MILCDFDTTTLFYLRHVSDFFCFDIGLIHYIILCNFNVNWDQFAPVAKWIQAWIHVGRLECSTRSWFPCSALVWFIGALEPCKLPRQFFQVCKNLPLIRRHIKTWCVEISKRSSTNIYDDAECAMHSMNPCPPQNLSKDLPESEAFARPLGISR